jgi:hypothetical protein
VSTGSYRSKTIANGWTGFERSDKKHARKKRKKDLQPLPHSTHFFQEAHNKSVERGGWPGGWAAAVGMTAVAEAGRHGFYNAHTKKHTTAPGKNADMT